MSATHLGSCYCGAVAIEATGAAEAMGYCHCGACRSYSGAPMGAFTLWKAENVKVTKGPEFVGRFKSSELSDRCYCKKCGGRVMVDHPGLGMIDLTPAILDDFVFKPAVHLNYDETVLAMKDGLPKLKDFPAEIGGSGQTMPE